jgi:hypothetical protein
MAENLLAKLELIEERKRGEGGEPAPALLSAAAAADR